MPEQPRWEQLADRLRRRIRTGRLAAGAFLPGERRLAAALGAARGTLCRALATLAQEGLLARGQGRGTQVAGDGARGADGLVHLVFTGPHAEPLSADRYLAALLGHLAQLGRRIPGARAWCWCDRARTTSRPWRASAIPAPAAAAACSSSASLPRPRSYSPACAGIACRTC